MAEVLITLGIIGVVAAMTMPSLTANHREKETVVKLKKFYSVISQAYISVINENGTPDNWNLKNDDAESAEYIFNLFKPYLKITKDCGFGAGCFPNEKYKHLDNTLSVNFLNDVNKRYMFTLADGSTVLFLAYDGTRQGRYGHIYIDINGKKSPNMFGKDLFIFSLLKERIIPAGLEISEEYVFETCITKGGFCTAWVLSNENMDYLHCPDLLDFETHKTSCK